MTDLLFDAVSRRTMIKAGALAVGSLIVACKHRIGPYSDPQADGDDGRSPFGGFLEITPDNKIRFISTRSEAGQGISAGFAVLLAEELDVDPAAIEVDYAGINNRRTQLTDMESSSTGGSSSARRFYKTVRTCGAAARDMLIAAAAAQWQVPVGECSVQDGKVIHPGTNNSATFGSLVPAASALSVPESPALKAAADYKYIGKSNRRSDILAKVTGAAVYGIDVKVEGMLSATIIHCPFVGGDLVSMDDTATRAQPGVKEVVKSPYGVIVIADTFWHALGGAKKLVLQWQQTCTASSAGILAEQKALAEAPAKVAANTGNFAATFEGAANKVEASYHTQYLPHSTLEPQNCTAWVKSDGTCEIWAPTQDPASACSLAAGILEIDESKVKVNVTLLGGGFGRRLRQDYVAEAVYAAKAVPNQPVKLLWQRSEEFTHDMYRPASYSKMQASLGENGQLTGWMHRMACSSIFSWLDEQPSNLIQPATQPQVDSSSVDGAARLDYGIPNFRCEWAQHEPGVPVFWWRAVGRSQNAFFIESFIDECAKKANMDPLTFRMNHLTQPRQKAVLALVREKSGWDTPAPAGVGRGVAIFSGFGSVVAQVAEVTVQTGTIHVQKVTVAVDCGTAMDANLVHTQMESAIAQALAATLKQEITLTNGRVNQTSFIACQPLKLSEMPAVETFIVPSVADPGGIGEPGVPPLAPAVANAVFALTGIRLRSTPLRFTGA